MNFQDAKAIVRAHLARRGAAGPEGVAAVLAADFAKDHLWRGMHPFYEHVGAEAIAEAFWVPLMKSLSSLQRRTDMFFAGTNDAGPEDESGDWVCHAGHYVGLFDAPFLGIPPTRKAAFLPYCEFLRVVDGVITESAFFCDIPALMVQAGINPFPPETAVEILRPGPRTHDGLLYDAQPHAEGAKTLALVNRMCADLTGAGMGSAEDQLRETWHEDMWWFGPTGIGSAYTVPRYVRQHQGPFGEGLADIVFNGHVARIAEGDFAGWFGWANLSMTASGGFLGMPASNRTTEMRVVDLYRRDGDKLAENWIYIDLLHFLHLQGLDVLGRMRVAG